MGKEPSAAALDVKGSFGLVRRRTGVLIGGQLNRAVPGIPLVSGSTALGSVTAQGSQLMTMIK